MNTIIAADILWFCLMLMFAICMFRKPLNRNIYKEKSQTAEGTVGVGNTSNVVIQKKGEAVGCVTIKKELS